MSYITLQTLTTSFRQAMQNTNGLNDHFVLYESEINSRKDYNYPICITEIPNSFVENINRGRETFKVVCFILKQNTENLSPVNTSSLYDDCISLFDSWLSNVMAQRDGEYILDRESVEIDRLQKFGADLCYGCKVTFNLIVPSVLIGSSSTAALNTTNILAHFNPKLGVTINYNSLSWASSQGLTITDSQLSLDVVRPAYSTISDSWIFQDITGTFQTAQPLFLNNVSMSSTSWSIFMLLKTEPNPQFMTLFSTKVTSDSSAPIIIAKIFPNNQANTNHPNELQITTEEGEGQHISIPVGDVSISTLLQKEFTPIGIVNDGVAEKIYIYIGTRERLELDVYDDNQWNNRDLYFGGTAYDDAIEVSLNPYVGQLKDILIYDEAVSSEKATNINEFLYRQ